MKGKTKLILLGAIFLGGYASLSLELIVIRQLAAFIGTTAVTTSIIIGVFLAFLALGYYKGATISLVSFGSRKLVFRSFLIISLTALLGTSYLFIHYFFQTLYNLNIKSNIAQTFIYSLIFLSLGPFLFGLITGTLSRYLHRENSNYTGKILAVDTIGSVMGSLLTTLVLMPFLGVNYATVILIALLLFSALLFIKKESLYPLALILLVAVVINSSDLLHRSFKIVENNAVSTIQIYEADGGKSKKMSINNSNSSKVSTDPKLFFPYVKFIEDNFIKTMPNDRKRDILILGAGGFTMGLHDTFNNYTFVDIDPSLLWVSEELFLEQELTENKKFIVQDGGQLLKDSQENYDLIVLDIYSSGKSYIPQDLITREFFQRVKAKVKENGIVVMNIISSPNFSDEYTKHLDNTISSVFTQNLSRQSINPFNAWDEEGSKHNILYIFYNKENDGGVYTYNKSAYFYEL